MMAFGSFEELQVWQRGRKLAVDVYGVLKPCRDFGLKDQMQRASVSIPSNIAEGFERTPKEFQRFLSIAIGSCSELRTQTYIAVDIGVLTQEQGRLIIDETKQLNRMMRSLSNAQNAKIKEEASIYETLNSEL